MFAIKIKVSFAPRIKGFYDANRFHFIVSINVYFREKKTHIKQSNWYTRKVDKCVDVTYKISK